MYVANPWNVTLRYCLFRYTARSFQFLLHDLPESLLEIHFKIHFNAPLNKENVRLVSIPVL